MKLKVAILAVGIFAGSTGISLAQDAEQQIPAAVSAAIEIATAICVETPVDCAAAMEAVLTAMRDAGLEGDALDNALVALAQTIIEVGAALPPAAQMQIASALQIVSNNLSPGAASEALAEIILAFDAGQGSSVVDVLASPN